MSTQMSRSCFGKLAVLCLALSGLSAAPVLAQENLLPDGDFEKAEITPKWGIGAEVETAEVHSGKSALRLDLRRWRFSPGENIQIDPNATYELSGWFKAPKGQHTANVLFGLRYFDKEGEQLSPVSSLPYADTETTLAVAAKKGDKVVILKPVKLIYSGAIAFDVKADYSDLPNHQTARLQVDTKTKENLTQMQDGLLHVQLREPVPNDYPAGTSVRQHDYIDYVQMGLLPGDEWTHYTIRYEGSAEKGNPPELSRVKSQFWHGTHSVKVGIFLGVKATEEDIHVLVDDVTFKKVAAGQ